MIVFSSDDSTTTTPPKPGSGSSTATTYYGSGDLYYQAREQLAADGNSSTAAAGPVTLAQTYNNAAVTGVVTMPNMRWYYSAADAYSVNDPNSPMVGAWNYGMDKTAAAAAYDDNALVSPQMRFWLDAVAYNINPLKKGRSLWEEAVAAAELSSQRGEYKTPYQIIQELYGGSRIQMPGTDSGGGGSYGGGGGSGYGGGGGGGQVSLTNPTSARGLLLQTMQNVLGRNPTESEYSTFLQTLNEAQMGNPMTVGVEGDTVVQSGGVDPGVLALEFAQGAEDYKSREASKYYNMFMAALGGAAGG